MSSSSLPLFRPLFLLFPLLFSMSFCLRLSTSVQTQSGPLPDPSHVADPSLLPVHLQRPDYRPLSGETETKKGGPKATMAEDEQTGGKEEGKGGDSGNNASETVMNMGGGEEMTTEQPKETEAELKEAEEKEKEAEEKEKEAEEKEKEAEEKEKEAEEKEKEAEEKQKEAEEKEKEAEEKEAEEKAANEVQENAKEAGENEGEVENKQGQTLKEEVPLEMPPASQAADEPFSGEAVTALVNAMRSAKLLVQNITFVVPSGESASLGVFLNALIGGRPAVPSPANGFPSQLSLQPMPSSSPGTALPLLDQPLSSNPSFSNCRPISAPQFQQFRPSPSLSLSVPSPTNYNFLVDVEQLHGWIKSSQNVKVIDASYEPDPGTTDHVQFYAEYYANWDKLMEEKKSRQYARSHIPGAVPFNVNIATYPSWNERQALYPADKFEQYMQRLGIDSGDRIVIYARGPMGGLLHAARVWFMLRTYGQEEVFVLDGGFDAWRRADLPANDVEVETELGNWKAHFRPELIVTFEQLTTAESDGFCILSRLNWFNFLDVRLRNEFFGLIGPQPFGSQRNRLSGSKPFPADELVQEGILAPPIEILRKLQQIGYLRGYQTIAMGNTADEASLALLALGQVQDTRAKLFNGGMEELRRRAPYLISKS